MRSHADDAEFWRRVDVLEVRDCWRWLGTQQGRYGTFYVKATREDMMAHRFAWAFAYGPIPTNAHVLHSCDSSWCVNPRHLRLGTHEDNNMDKTVVSRVRAVLAEASRLDVARVRAAAAVPDAIRPIRESATGATIKNWRAAAGLTQRQLAKKLGVSPAALCGWEKGTSGMTLSRARAVSQVLNIPLAELLA